jgi:valyl-tRNA synthetase
MPTDSTCADALPKTWDPGAVEGTIYQRWLDAGYFTADPNSAKPARGASLGGGLTVGEDQVRASRNFATKLFNATRFALLNGAAVGPGEILPTHDDLTDADRWILDRLEEVRAEVDSVFDGYEFSRACESLYHFTWDEFCDWYVELAKTQLAVGLSHTAAVLAAVLDTLLRLLHPVIPFITEALWQAVTGSVTMRAGHRPGEEPANQTTSAATRAGEAESLAIADWPRRSGISLDPVAARRITDIQKLVTEIRRFRSDQGLADRQKVPARLLGIDAADLSAQVGAVTSLAWLTAPGPEFSPSVSLEVGLGPGPTGLKSLVVVELDTSGTIDVGAERRRLGKDLAAAQKELASTTAKLGNAGFPVKAPAAVVDKQRERQRVAREETDRIAARLAGLQ